MIRIITDSVASIPHDAPAREHIQVLTLYVNYNGMEYADDTMNLDEFYTDIYEMAENLPTSSQPSQHTFETAFEDAARAGDQVLGIFISSGLSGAYEGALRAVRAVKSRNVDFEYALIDSTSCCFDEAFPVYDAIDAVAAGCTLEQAARAVLNGMQSTRFLFTPESLTFLQKGGRIGNAAALLGNLVQIAPVLTVRDTKATTFCKVRFRSKALARIMKTMKEDMAEHGGLKRVMVHYIGKAEPALEWARDVVEPFLGHAVEVCPASAVIGTHVGPSIGIVYECNHPIKGKITGSTAQYLCTH